MSRRFIVICEAPADQQTACTLADRVLLEEIEWLEEFSDLDHQRSWSGIGEAEVCLLWKHIPRLAREKRILPRGFGNGDERTARQAMLLLKSLQLEFSAVLLIRDSDNRELNGMTRREQLERAREDSPLPPAIPICIGVAHTKRECWVLAGFTPENQTETETLTEQYRHLSFYPCEESERLTSSGNAGERNAKQVMKALISDDRVREQRCIEGSDLNLLRKRGGKNGLSEYLDEIKDRLVPLIAGYTQP